MTKTDIEHFMKENMLQFQLVHNVVSSFSMMKMNKNNQDVFDFQG